jgi:hypothetical protein
MAAFPSHAIHRLQENVKLLHERRKKAGRMVLTHDEYVQLFVPPESREHFRAIAYLMPKTSAPTSSSGRATARSWRCV